MKVNLPVTDNERSFSGDRHLLSLTDLKGIITHANQNFIDVSGFSADELARKNHNIVRHPDMPPAAFDNLWTTLKAGKPWMGIVKNRCKNGDHYWVDAYVAPVFEGGRTVGYQSVRTTASKDRVRRAAAIYRRLKDGKRPRLINYEPPATIRHFVALYSVMIATLAVGVAGGTLALPIAGGALIVGGGVCFGLARLQTRRLRALAGKARAIFDNPLMRQVYTGASDEIAQTELALVALQAQLRTAMGRVDDSVTELSDLARQTVVNVEQTSRWLQLQQTDTEQVAAAMHEMTATVQEVARNTNEAAQAAQHADQEVGAGGTVVTQTMESIAALADDVQQAADVIQKLHGESENIGTVLDVIRSIAEQTNLLALNAAIEAARAGQHGRGFAVVADEVRTLAQRTQDSTEQIQSMIERLQAGSSQAVEAMNTSRERAADSVSQAEIARQSLQTIHSSVARIHDMTTQIASAAEEQGAVAEEISRNIVNISSLAQQTASGARETEAGSEALAGMARNFESLVQQLQL